MTPDKELATRVANSGDQSAFAELVERHQLPIRRFLRRLTGGDHAAADDLAQETFLAAYQKMHTFRGKSALGTWLHTIAYRQFVSMTRKHKRWQVMPEPPDAGTDPRADTDREILVQQLMTMLKPGDRACVTLNYAVGMSHADIANVIGLPVGTVKARIHRARGKLKKWLESHDHTLQTQATVQERNHAG